MPSRADHAGFVGMSFFSDNQGYIWQASKNTVDSYPIEFQEADAVELEDGRIMLFARTYSGHPARAYSSDMGQTWSKGEFNQGTDHGKRRRFPVYGEFHQRVIFCLSG